MGNKNDDPARKQVDTQDAVRFGESVGVRVFETSAKENSNVEEVTFFILDQISSKSLMTFRFCETWIITGTYSDCFRNLKFTWENL